jgi:hypothetical protein
MNLVDNKFPSVNKSSVDKSFNKLMKKCFKINFFKLTRFLKKSIACVNIVKLQSSISSLEIFTLCLIIKRFSLSIFAFAHHHAAHSIVYQLLSHVLILSNCMRGFNLLLSLGYSNGFFVILQFFLICL